MRVPGQMQHFSQDQSLVLFWRSHAGPSTEFGWCAWRLASKFRRWSVGRDCRNCQTFTASPAEPGDLPRLLAAVSPVTAAARALIPYQATPRRRWKNSLNADGRLRLNWSRAGQGSGCPCQTPWNRLNKAGRSSPGNGGVGRCENVILPRHRVRCWAGQVPSHA